MNANRSWKGVETSKAAMQDFGAHVLLCLVQRFCIGPSKYGPQWLQVPDSSTDRNFENRARSILDPAVFLFHFACSYTIARRIGSRHKQTKFGHLSASHWWSLGDGCSVATHRIWPQAQCWRSCVQKYREHPRTSHFEPVLEEELPPVRPRTVSSRRQAVASGKGASFRSLLEVRYDS